MGQPRALIGRPSFAFRSQSNAPVARSLILVVGLLTACSGASKETNFSFLSSPAQGRPATCPDDAVDPGGPGGGPMAPKCSYDNAKSGLVQLRGSVLLQGADGTRHAPAEGMRVTVHRDGGDSIGRTVSDAQGRFSVSLSTGPGSYRLRAVAEESGEVLAERPFVIVEGARSVDGLDLLLTVDPALR